ncbi:MAG: class I SAM-dependent methyltransferase [Desulfurivibrio sp.]|nr:class I SAM-dependent methyltransferase [Desulfurivibrio sp.]MBU4034485.1 class I SAM-dependent methyltransferase [Pseudomonadota bacterium]
MRYQDIDWEDMWREARAHKSWKKKKSSDWDRRASSFAERNIDSPFVAQFISHLHIEPEWSVLDVGSGPGTLAIPLSNRVRSVTAVDYSAAMLNELDKRAKGAGQENITTIQASWTDDWQTMGIPRHEITIASRSLSVDDLKGALRKLNDWATKAVYIVDRVGAGPFDPDLFKAIGRDFQPGPDYIFTVNLLYTLGIHAHIDFITLDSKRTYTSREEALQSYRWMADELTDAEEERLIAYVDARLNQTGDNSWQLARQTSPRWALIWWQK